MKKFLTMFLIILLCVSAFSGCDNVLSQNGGSQTTDDTLNTNAECEHNWERIGNLNESTAQDKCTKCGETRLYTDPDSINTDNGINDHVPYDSMLNLEIINGKFRFQRIATTPCIVYSNSPITDMSNGTMYDDRHDILTAVFRATDGKDAIMDTTECEFLHYIYMFDNEREDVPWHYRFAICSCGAVMITNNNQFLCTIEISDDELRTILDSFDTSEEDHEIPNDPDSFKTLYTVEITNSENYPILNELKASYRMGEKVTIELETITEHYYVLYVNGVEQSPDETGTNDWSVTCYTFSMPAENVIITIEDRWVDIPENSQGTGQQEGCEHD